MSFFECEFPRTISFKAAGGPEFSTTVNQGLSGAEQRNQNWLNPRGKWQISLESPAARATTLPQFIQDLETFFLNVGGKRDGFRFFDHKDNSFANETIGTGTGTFQLIKTYAVGGRSYVRNITKPIWHTAVDYQGHVLQDTVQIYANGVLLPAANWTIDATTGLVTVTSGAGSMTASGQFDFPVRLDTDGLQLAVEPSAMAKALAGSKPIVSWTGIQLIEVLPPNY